MLNHAFNKIIVIYDENDLYAIDYHSTSSTARVYLKPVQQLDRVFVNINILPKSWYFIFYFML